MNQAAPPTAMRDAFITQVYRLARQDRRVMLLSDDFGAPSLDDFRSELSSQYIYMGIAEQNMVSIAAGLALGGKIVFMYGIAPFITERCFEQIKVDLCYMNLPVTAVGVGSGFGYSTAGPTHHTTEDVAIMSSLPGMTVLCPSDSNAASAFAQIAYKTPGPKYVRLERDNYPLLYEQNHDFKDGFSVLQTGQDLIIIATGIMVHQAINVAKELAYNSIEATVIDLYRIKPLNEKLLLPFLKQTSRIVTMEEHVDAGGIGSMVGKILAENGLASTLKCFTVPDRYYFKYSGRQNLLSACGLDVETMNKAILDWLDKKTNQD